MQFIEIKGTFLTLFQILNLYGAIVFLFILPSIAEAASLPNLPLDEISLYEAAERARSSGLSEELSLSVRPLSRSNFVSVMGEILEHRERNPVSAKRIYHELLPYFKNDLSDEGYMVRGLSHPWAYIKPFDRIKTASILFHNERNKRRNLDNGEGIFLYEGLNQLVDIDGRGIVSPYFSFYYSFQGNIQREQTRGELKKGYLKYRNGRIAIQLGRDSLWFGPGVHGSILLSNNAFPLDMIKINNESPYSLLGDWRFTIFNALLSDRDRKDFKDPDLAGMQVSYQPHPVIELAIERTILYGGEGRSEYNMADYWELFTANGEHIAGAQDNDQYMGYYFTLYLPFLRHFTPLNGGRMYWGKWGTDVDTRYKGPTFDNMLGFAFNDHAILKGLFLTSDTIDFRYEFATTYKTFYAHGVYHSGYQYRGQMLGHHMGRDASDAFYQVTIRIVKNNEFKISYDEEKHWTSQSSPYETRKEYTVGNKYIGGKWDMVTNLQYTHYENFNESRDPMKFNIVPISNQEWAGQIVFNLRLF